MANPILRDEHTIDVTILILIDGFLQYRLIKISNYTDRKVTILILIDGFLQFHIGWRHTNEFEKSQSLF